MEFKICILLSFKTDRLKVRWNSDKKNREFYDLILKD